MVIFICPTIYASGGPEAIHQLAGKCMKMGVEVGIYYYNPNKLPLDERLAYYGIPQVTTVVDSVDNIVVFPESIIDDMFKISNAVRVLWWLSVDNARMSAESEVRLKIDKKVVHFSQSYYATKYVREKFGVEAERLLYVSDYLNSVYLSKPDDWAMADITGDYSPIDRERVVLFNPKKGFANTAALIMYSTGDIKWQALNGMTPAQMRAAMQKAMVYVDFGSHPGMDRIPREAALSGCCVITNKVGSAANNIDVPIRDEYKCDFAEHGANEILGKIIETMDNYVEAYTRDFTEYTKIIREQFKLFEVSIYQAFSRIITPDTEVFRENNSSLIDMIRSVLEKDDLKSAYRYIVRYRYEGLVEDERFCILENAIRIAVGEYDEAKYCTLNALNKYPQSYELYLGLIQSIVLISERDGFVTEQDKYYYSDSIEKAQLYSAGTEDEETVKSILSGYVNE